MKTLILTVIAAIVFFFGMNNFSYSSQPPKNNDIKIVHKPKPNHKWVAGHYKYNKYGKLVWVPGHWKKIR